VNNQERRFGKMKRLILQDLTVASRTFTALSFVLLFIAMCSASFANDRLQPVIQIDVHKTCQRCPAYALLLFQDGTVVYEGKESVRVVGEVRTSVSRGQVEAFLQRFRQAGFFTLRSELRDKRLASLPIATIFIRDAEQEHRVTFQAWQHLRH
jgi:hypothetical protein